MITTAEIATPIAAPMPRATVMMLLIVAMTSAGGGGTSGFSAAFCWMTWLM